MGHSQLVGIIKIAEKRLFFLLEIVNSMQGIVSSLMGVLVFLMSKGYSRPGNGEFLLGNFINLLGRDDSRVSIAIYL